MKGVRARYHGSVDEIRRAIEFIRQKYEFGMRAYITTGSAEEQRRKPLLDYASMQGMPEEEINGIQKVLQNKLGRMVTIDNLRDALREHIAAKKGRVTKPSMTSGGKVCSALLVKEDDLVHYLEVGCEVIKELSDS